MSARVGVGHIEVGYHVTRQEFTGRRTADRSRSGEMPWLVEAGRGKVSSGFACLVRSRYRVTRQGV